MGFIVVVIVIIIAWSMFKGKGEVQNCWFPVSNAALDTAIRSFGELCYKMAKVIPQEKREEVIIRVTVERENVRAILCVDTMAVNLQKISRGISLRKAMAGSTMIATWKELHRELVCRTRGRVRV